MLARNTFHLRSESSSSLPKDTSGGNVENDDEDALNPIVVRRRYVDHAEASEEWLVGPMPVQKFLDEFLSLEGDGSLRMPSPKRAFNNVPTKPKDRKEIQTALAPAINDFGRCPSLRLFDTAKVRDVPASETANPGLCAYEEKELDMFKQADRNVSANLGFAEFFVQVEVPEFLDPFNDPHPNLGRYKRAEHQFIVEFEDEADQERAKRLLYQNVAHAAEACARQHRAFYFSVSIFGTHARFIRWDRAGAIVTQSFDYRRNPQLLCDFLWRFSQASSRQRGYDPSVVVASEAEEKLFRKMIIANVAFQLDIKDARKLAKAVNRHYEPGRVVKMDVYNEAQRTFDRFLVCRPVKLPTCLTGTSTRGYWAVRLGSDSEIAFIIDTWRPDETDVEMDVEMEMEGPIYESLKNKGMVNISDVYCHGEVPGDIESVREKLGVGGLQGEVSAVQSGTESAYSNENAASSSHGSFSPDAQCTRTNEFIQADWACNSRKAGSELKVFKHKHYRVALKEVGYPLEEFTGKHEFFDATGDTFEALNDAIEKCNRLHHDVSMGNIILVRDRRTGLRKSFLTDWELSTTFGHDAMAEGHLRSGTQAYMSTAAPAGEQDFRHPNADHMESVLHDTLHYCARWLPHNRVHGLSRWIHDFLDSYSFFEGRFVEGAAKRTT